MGYGMSIYCPECGYEETFMLGIGMMYSSLEAVLDFMVPSKRRDHIRKIISESELPMTEYEHKLYECPRCDTLHGRFYIEIRDKGELVFQTYFRCGDCRARLVEAAKDVLKYNCRRCGKKSLQRGAELMWD